MNDQNLILDNIINTLEKYMIFLSNNKCYKGWKQNFLIILFLWTGFGNGTDVVWSPSGDYAVRDSYNIKIMKGNTNAQIGNFKPDFQVEELFGGVLL